MPAEQLANRKKLPGLLKVISAILQVMSLPVRSCMQLIQNILPV